MILFVIERMFTASRHLESCTSIFLWLLLTRNIIIMKPYIHILHLLYMIHWRSCRQLYIYIDKEISDLSCEPRQVSGKNTFNVTYKAASNSAAFQVWFIGFSVLVSLINEVEEVCLS